MITHGPSPAGCCGFCAFSTSAIISSNAFCTFSLCRADASVHAQFHLVVRAFPSSWETCRCIWRSDLLPTTTIGTQSAPYKWYSAKDIRENLEGSLSGTKWFKTLSRIISTMSKDCLDATEYTSIYPWIPIEWREFKILYSSWINVLLGFIDTRDIISTNLPCCIYDFSGIFLVLVFDNSRKCIFYRWVVRLHKVVLYKLDCERRFTCSVGQLYFDQEPWYALSYETSTWNGKEQALPTARLPTIAILRCFTWVGIISDSCT